MEKGDRKIPIRNLKLPKKPRVFDVVISPEGTIKQYQMQNIQGSLFIDSDDVKRQIWDALKQ